jgi:hypothetical protein
MEYHEGFIVTLHNRDGKEYKTLTGATGTAASVWPTRGSRRAGIEPDKDRMG